jgi:glycine dehydrogenase subunit 2
MTPSPRPDSPGPPDGRAAARAVGSPGDLNPRSNEQTITIFERSREGRRAFVAPECDVPEVPVEDLLPASARRERPAELPEISEPEIVRHYNTLSKKNFDLDTGFYPLGSCTMKHNPKLHERLAALPGHARLHPLQDPEYAQGALELMWRLQGDLAEISGLPHVSLQPSAGSHGELAGLLLTRAYHEDHGEQRTKVLTPDTAHGTNPATVTMAGYKAVKVGTAEDGGVDLDDLRQKATEDVACLMLTNPNTLGLFDTNIEEIAHIVHDVGATLYYDGANLNAVMGKTRPGDMGFDIVHFNLHKTFTQPHGGGGPGAGPIAVSDRMEPFLPTPQVVRRGGRGVAGPDFVPSRTNGESGAGEAGGGEPYYDLDHDRPKSIGKLRGFQGNFGVFVRSYAYIRSLGGDGLQEASEVAVLNANYLKARLAEAGIGEYLPIAFDRTCMHEFVLSGRGAKEQLQIKTLDIAKRLLDHGVHPPTVYFPLLVDEALMIEPTETETKERLDHFADAIRSILEEAKKDPEIAKGAPYTTPVRRLDEAGAAKRPVVRWRPGEKNPGEAERAKEAPASGSGAM